MVFEIYTKINDRIKSVRFVSGFFFNRSLVSKYFICIRNPWEQNCNQSKEIFLEHLLRNEYFSDTSNGKQKNWYLARTATS